MSFRSRLLLFFMIIVIVPMIAVALVLFSITADSETGKSDAAIAQGLRAAFAVYDADRAKAHPTLEAVARDPLLAGAIAKHDKVAAARRLPTDARAPPPPPPAPPPPPTPPPPTPGPGNRRWGGCPAPSSRPPWPRRRPEP